MISSTAPDVRIASSDASIPVSHKPQASGPVATLEAQFTEDFHAPGVPETLQESVAREASSSHVLHSHQSEPHTLAANEAHEHTARSPEDQLQSATSAAQAATVLCRASTAVSSWTRS